MHQQQHPQHQQQQMVMMNPPSVGAAIPSGPAPGLVYMPVPIRSTTYDRFQHKQSLGLGITLFIIGLLCIIFNGVAIGMTDVEQDYSDVAYIGHGIWCGSLFIITGGFGIGAAIKKTRCLIVTFMVMCILSAVTTISLLAIAIVGACEPTEYCDYDYNYGYGSNYPYYRTPCAQMSGYETVVAMEALMAILGFFAGVFCIWGSALCCGSGVCCCSTHSTPVIAQQQFGYYPNSHQIVYVNQSHTAGQNLYQGMQFPYSQGMIAPPYGASYAQPGWTMHTMHQSSNISEPLNIGQAPPEYPATLDVSLDPVHPTVHRKY